MSELRNPLVAIVEDDDDLRSATVDLMRSAGYDAAPFTSANDFLNSHLLDAVAAIITDIQMPGMSGLELQDLLQARGNATPLIIITAYPTKRTRDRALAAGAAGFFSKPFDSSALIECVENALNARP